MGRNRAKIFIIDDSRFFSEYVKRSLSEYRWLDVVGTASDPYDASDKIVSTEPDVIIMDVEMPHMNGIEFLKLLKEQWPIPVIVISSNSTHSAESKVAGAVDFILKPSAATRDTSGFIDEIARITKRICNITDDQTARPDLSNIAANKGGYKFNGIIALGASTGGTQSTSRILRDLPGDMPGMVVVQHMPPTFTKMYAEGLNSSCKVEVREAKSGDAVTPGLVLIAPGDYQMELIGGPGKYAVRCFKGEKVNSHCPSVDVLFHSVARVAGKDALGVILTGMGADGAAGLLEMRKRGAFTIGQDEKTSIVYGMPMEAYNMGAVCRQLPLDGIASALIKYALEMR